MQTAELLHAGRLVTVQQLEERVARERQSYDKGEVWQRCDRLHGRFAHVFQCRNTRFAEAERENLLRQEVKGAKVLDYGCGDGWFSAALLAMGPKRLVGIDVSARELAKARQALGDKAEFLLMDAHRLSFSDDSFDLVVGRSILHHLQFEVALAEVRRVLRPGGVAAFVEPLADNPAAKLYQVLTRKAHTPDEWPLSRKQIEWADGFFRSSDHLFCGFFSTALGLVTSLLTRDADNLPLRVADRVDRVAARTPVRYWMRCAYLTWTKRP